eukprot:m.86527 g.86527  ORF g.86527 m.86527 type:complete len:390 (+) comp14472_c0_seq1:161-1330(+)
MSKAGELSAWFEKKGEINPSWKKRWFDLKDNCIEYRKAPSDAVPRGVVNLSNARLQTLPPEDNNWQDRLAIHTASGRTYMIRAKLALLKEWIPAIQSRINAASSSSGEAPVPRAAPSDSISEMAGMTVEEARRIASNLRPSAIVAGFIEKKGEQRKSWRIRWFELRESRLDYFKHPGDSTPKGSIMLRDSDVTVNEDTSDSATTASGLVFLEITPAASSRTYRLRGPKEAIQEWEVAIRRCIGNLKHRQSKYKAGPMIQDGVGLSADEVRQQFSSQGTSTKTSGSKRAPGPLISQGRVVDLPQGLEPQQQQQQMQQMQVDMKADVIKQRDQEVKHLHESMQTINSMMKDMADLIRDQGDTLTEIERQANDVHDRVAVGVDHLGVALKRT